MSVPTRWGGLSEAPSLADTTLVCEGANQQFFALWRRHERASECVWIDQANLTLRSGAIFDMQNFPVMADPNLDFGAAGEVAVIVECDDPVAFSDEMMDLWLDFDQQWQDLGSTTGVMSIHTKRLVDEDGDSCARGIVAEIGDPAMPWMAVSDPQDLCEQSDGDCQYNERSLAHEFGHLCDLRHVTTAGRLMVTGGDTDDTTLTQSEINTCRDYIDDNAGTFDFDAPAGADFVAAADFAVAPTLAAATPRPTRPVAAARGDQLVQPAHDVAFDPDGDVKDGSGLDMRKIMVQRDATGGLELHVVTDGLMGPESVGEFIFAIDIDNNPNTGSGLAGVLGDDNVISGVEWIGSVKIDRAPRACTSFEPLLRVATAATKVPFDKSVGRGEALFAQAPRFTEVKHPAIKATFRTACVVICDFDARTDFHSHVEVPSVQRLVMTLPGELVTSTGPIRVQIFSRNPTSGEIDALPNTPAEMTFGRPVFPGMQLNPREARTGDVVQISVSGMRPGSELHTILGATEIDTGPVVVGNQGGATILMEVPGNVAVGPHLVTVGADVFTADDILQVVERKPTVPGKPGKRGVFELLVSYEDLLRRQAIQLDKFSDLIDSFNKSMD